MNVQLRHGRWGALALLVLPTLVIGVRALQLEWNRAAQPSLRVAITGYDPRDLLRGHYLEFRLDLEFRRDAPAGDGQAGDGWAGDGRDCACLRPNPADARRPNLAPASCEEAPTVCPHLIKAPRQIYRYYAPETRARTLETEIRAHPGGASVVVHFHGDGEVSFSDLAGP